MPSRFVPALICCAAWLAASAAQAQPASAPAKDGPSTTVAPLTVQAAPAPTMIRKQTRAFVRGFPPERNGEHYQIARWRDPLCVKVTGLADAQATMIKARIESVAQAVNVRLARAPCTANVEILFTDRPQALMDMVAKRAELMLGYYHLHDRDRLKQVTRPVQAWYVTAASPWAGREVIDDPESHAPTGCSDDPGALACGIQTVFKNVLVVADAKALQGQDAGLLSDYLVMLTLSQPRSLDGCNILASVIDVLAPSACSGRDVPDGLTASDAAYLTALYEADPYNNKNFEQSDITRRMSDILIKANVAARDSAESTGSPPADTKAR